MEECLHMVKSISTTNLKKRFNKGDKKALCHPCQFKPFNESNEHWCCLQCGNVGCGDQDAQNGDAIQHYNTPRSDLHAIVVHIEKDSKCWCFECKAEINNRSGHVKDAIAIVKRNMRYSPALRNNKQNSVTQQTSSGPVVAIPLPPPVPHIPSPPANPLPRNESPTEESKITCSHQQNKKNSSLDISDKPAGLTNLGNTCFMNSALQCLASTRLLIPKLEIFGRDQELKMLVTQVQDEALITIVSPDENRKSIDEKESPDYDGSGDYEISGNRDISSDLHKPLQITLEIGPETMTGRLRQTIRGIRKFETSKYDTGESSTSNRDYSTSSYFNAYRPAEVHELVAKNFRRGAQHDAHELLRTIVDMMKKDQTKAFRFAVMKHFGMKKGGEGSDPSLVELVKSLDEKVRHKTFVDDVFGGELMTTQTCLTCNHVKRSHEQFLDLSLPLRVIKHDETEKKPGRKNFFNNDRNNIVIMKSLEDCLHYFTEPELLTGSNVVECENCHKISLEKIEAGISPDKVFPMVTSEKSSSQSSPDTERKNVKNIKKHEDRKKKRPSRQSKLKNQIIRKNSITKEDVEEEGKEKEVQPGPSSLSMPMIENHFNSYGDCTVKEKEMKTKDRAKKSDGETSTQSLDDYVVIQSEFSTSGSKRKIGDVDHSDAGDHCDMELGEVEDGMPPLVEESASSTFASSKVISESLQNLSMLKLGDEGEEVTGDTDALYDVDAGEEYVDFDLPPAMDGIGGSASDGDEDNGVPQLDLGLPSYDKFESFHVPQSIAEDDEKENEPLIVEKPSTADEGFSEGENSMSVDNEVARRVSQGPSASSSRNSLSDSDETSKSLSNDEGQKATLYSRIPKVTKCPCSRQQSISRPPEFLTIHFKRFQMSLGGYPTKINENVKYPMILDLTPFCSRDGADKSSDEDGQILYALYGIVEHGGSMNWGHYVAYVKSSENDKRWFHISDSSVSVTSPNRLTSIEAYILFYERIRGEEKNRRLSVAIPSPTASLDEPEKTEAVDWNCENWDIKPEDETTEQQGAVGFTVSADDELWDIPPASTTEFQVKASGEVTSLELDEVMDSFDNDIQIQPIDEWGVKADNLSVSGVSSAGWGDPITSEEWSMNDEKKTGMEWTTIGGVVYSTPQPSPSVTSSTNSFVDVCQVGLGPMDMNITFYRHETEEEVKEEDDKGGAEENLC